MPSLILDDTNWDLCIDVSGNIAVCKPPYSDAQDAACQMLLFSGESRFDKSQGVPYWSDILGKWPPLAVMKADLAGAALLATYVTDAQAFITSWKNRAVGGYVVTTNVSGKTSMAAWNSLLKGA